MLEKTLAPKPRRSKISVALKHADLCLKIQYGEMEKDTHRRHVHVADTWGSNGIATGF